MCCGGDIIETHDRALIGHLQPGLGQGANGAEGCHIIEGHHRSEMTPSGQEFSHGAVASLRT